MYLEIISFLLSKYGFRNLLYFCSTLRISSLAFSLRPSISFWQVSISSRADWVSCYLFQNIIFLKIQLALSLSYEMKFLCCGLFDYVNNNNSNNQKKHTTKKLRIRTLSFIEAKNVIFISVIQTDVPILVIEYLCY